MRQSLDRKKLTHCQGEKLKQVIPHAKRVWLPHAAQLLTVSPQWPILRGIQPKPFQGGRIAFVALQNTTLFCCPSPRIKLLMSALFLLLLNVMILHQ
jgi:hypothetical protein